MSTWVNLPLTLLGKEVRLVSLNESHIAELEILAQDKRIWEFYPYDLTNKVRFLNVFKNTLIEMEKGSQVAFVIIQISDNKIIGSTRLLDLDQRHRKLEIGSTWLVPDYWGTSINLECKLLLLTFCFEELNTIRVQLKTDERNIRSRTAIQKIGGQFEGILRNEMIRDDKTYRNSAFYSLIESEWEINKKNLSDLLMLKRGTTNIST